MITRVLDGDELLIKGDTIVCYVINREIPHYEIIVNGLAGHSVEDVCGYDASWYVAALRWVKEEVVWDFSFQVKCSLEEAELTRDLLEANMPQFKGVSFHKLLPEDGGEE